MNAPAVPFGTGVTVDQIKRYASAVWSDRSRPWYERVAATAINKGRVLFIPGRRHSDVYLVRMWLSDPKIDADGEFDSGNTTMLHFFPRGDDDCALHDHPMDFESTILVGGYEEHLPDQQWNGSYGRKRLSALIKHEGNYEQRREAASLEMQKTLLGPSWNSNIQWRLRGDVITHQAEDLHCVGSTLPGTFTLVQTGLKRRRWGFWPPGKHWMYWKDFVYPKTAEAAV